MSAAAQRRYRFASAGHWQAGLMTRVDGDALAASGAVAPCAPYGERPQSFNSKGAHSPAAARDGSIFWRDGAGALHLLEADEAIARVLHAPLPPGPVRRMAAGRDNLWLAGEPASTLFCHDSGQLARRFVVDLTGARLRDFSADGRDGVWALVEQDGIAWCVHIDCAGYQTARFAPAGLEQPGQLTWLAQARRLVVLAAGGKRLHWFAPGNPEPLYSIDIHAVRPCFNATVLGSDGRARIVLAGLEHDAYGGAARVLALDADGAALGSVPLPAAATGIHATRHCLLVTTENGLLRFSPGSRSDAGTETSCVFVTPVLQSPITDNPRRWLRAEAFATLPLGTSLEISYASSADPQVQKKALRIAADRSGPPARRVARLREHLGEWQTPFVFGGTADCMEARETALAIPLFDVRAPWLWVCVTLVAAPGAALPRLHRLDVLYPGLTLMQYLPAVYQRAEAEPGNFLRALVGVLETGTQELDHRIGSMGSMIAPDTAPAAWLDYVAGWLGVPWDEALDEQQKRRLLKKADQLAAGRGTRAGLETLLEALMPGRPARYRVTDLNLQYGFATLGGAACGGSPLPAILAGLPSSALALNRKAVLGKGRLTCKDAPPDPVARLSGHVTVGIVASAAERAAWEPWLANVIGDVLPLTARLKLEWRSTAAQLLDQRIGADLVLADAPAPHLGTDAVTGLARLPQDGAPRL